jgi:hypothetical protein
VASILDDSVESDYVGDRAECDSCCVEQLSI